VRQHLCQKAEREELNAHDDGAEREQGKGPDAHGAGRDPLDAEITEHGGAQEYEQHSNKAEKMERAVEVSAQENERKKVQKSFDKFAESVFASAEPALVMGDRDLGHAPSDRKSVV
jgi:hypothetical protein